MLNWLSKLFGRERSDQARDSANEAEAYELGQRAAAAISTDIEQTTDALLLDRRRNFLAVLDGGLSGIKEVEGVTYAEQVQIEYKIMLENWSDRMPEQEQEVLQTIIERWPSEFTSFDTDLIRDLIHTRVGWHYSQLISDGLEHGADAVSIQANPAGSKRV